jgi:hypothetical protein
MSDLQFHFYGTAQNGDPIEFSETVATAARVAQEEGVTLTGYVSDDPEVQAAQGHAVTVRANGTWAWS